MRLTFPPSFARSRGAHGPGGGPLPGANGGRPDEPEVLFNEELLARLRRLVILSRKSVAEGLAGEHRSRRRGSSPEFADFKSYSQGDDFRRIDWNIYSRLDEVFVRLSEVTTELTIHVLLDASSSMDWRGDPAFPTKFTYARRLAGSLSYVSLWRFDRVVIAPFGRDLGQPFGPAQGRNHVIPMLHYLSALRPMGATDLPTALDRYVRARRRAGILVLVSDLLSGEPAELAAGLRMLRARGWQAIVLHVADQVELAPAAMAADGGRPVAAELVEVESGERLRITPSPQVLGRYQAAMASWLGEVEGACQAEEADYLRLLTSWPVATMVLQILHRRGIVA